MELKKTVTDFTGRDTDICVQKTSLVDCNYMAAFECDALEFQTLASQ